ncbi:MAG: hypothetical protein GY842_23295 [bacterium]|nr:hypothetical protein [bacterium]
MSVHVYVDDLSFESGLDAAGTVGELLDEVRASLCGSARMVMGVRADGLDITGEEYGDTLGRAAETFDRFDFITADPRRVVCEALDDCQGLLTEADAHRTEAIELLTRGDSDEGTRVLGECCRRWQQVNSAILNAVALLGLDPGVLVVDDRPLAEALNGALAPLNQVREALAARDFVLIADVLQYEFDPAIEGWHVVLATVREAARRNSAGD